MANYGCHTGMLQCLPERWVHFELQWLDLRPEGPVLLKVTCATAISLSRSYVSVCPHGGLNCSVDF